MTTMKNAKISILGLGMMGQAIAAGLVKAHHGKKLLSGTTRTRAGATRIRAQLGIEAGIDNVAAAAKADVLVLALKPMQVLEVARELAAAGAVAPRSLVISIAAGVTTGQLEEILGPKVAVVRAMPNTPCSIGCGTTVLSPGKRAGEGHIATARRIFAPLGRVLELEEKHMNTVTGLSASGPAFVYVILEALADGGVARGLPRQTAIEMAAQMVYGAASMVLATGRHPAALKDDVTTPAGCTIAGILALEDGRIRSVLSRAVEVASVRAGELASPK
jgi:pyrroline-5-carboxylate reductase